MLKFYYHPSPNPAKVALLLEELGLPYELVPVDTRKGEQHQPEFLAINPNAKTPAIVDGDVTVFDSNAILLYLAEKTGKFLPESTPKLRGELLSWLMFVATGIGPYSGQAVHFRHFAPEPKEYPVSRYLFEAKRHWGIIDARLEGRALDGGRYLHHRRHGGVGLGAGDPVHPGRGGLDADARTSSACSTRSARGRRRSAPARSRTGTPTRPRWTRTRGGTCSRTSAGRPPEVSRGGCGCCPRPRRRLRPDQCHRSDRR